jgi:hypothetical protein
MFRLLKSFVRELPSPLLPHTAYEECLLLASRHMGRVVQELRENAHWRAVLDKYQQLPGGELDLWAQNIWGSGLGRYVL